MVVVLCTIASELLLEEEMCDSDWAKWLLGTTLDPGFEPHHMLRLWFP